MRHSLRDCPSQTLRIGAGRKLTDLRSGKYRYGRQSSSSPSESSKNGLRSSPPPVLRACFLCASTSPPIALRSVASASSSSRSRSSEKPFAAERSIGAGRAKTDRPDLWDSDPDELSAQSSLLEIRGALKHCGSGVPTFGGRGQADRTGRSCAGRARTCRTLLHPWPNIR